VRHRREMPSVGIDAQCETARHAPSSLRRFGVLLVLKGLPPV
jgi:hypothetical protein